jgi:WD40 repeat protein
MARNFLGGLILLGFAPLASAQSGPPTKKDTFGDPLPPGALARLGTTRLRHGGPIVSLAWSQDGKVLASASHDKTVCLWDTSDGKLLRRFTEPTDAVFAVVLSKDGKLVAAAGRDQKVRVWDRATGKLLWASASHGEEIYCLAFSHNSKWLATGVGMVRLWDAATGKPGQEFRGSIDIRHATYALAFSPDDTLLASGAEHGDLCLWDVKSGELRHKMHTAGNRAVYGLAFSPDGQLLASAHGMSVGAHWWNVNTGQCAGKLSGMSAGLAVQFSPDGKTLVVAPCGEIEPALHWFDLKTGDRVRNFDTGFFDCFAVAQSPDGKTVAYAGCGPRIVVRDVSNSKETLPAVGAETHIVTMAVPRQGKSLVASTRAGTTFLYDGTTGKALRTLVKGGTARRVFCASPDGNRLIVDDPADGLSLRNLDAKAAKDVIRPIPKEKEFYAEALSHDGRMLALAGREEVVIWDVVAGKEVRKLRIDVWLAILNLSPDGTWLLANRLVGVEDSKAKCEVWHIPSGKPVSLWKEGMPVPWAGMTFTADGRSIIAEAKPGQLGL